MIAVLGPTKPFPRLGGAAVVAHFGGRSEPATIIAIEDGGRRLMVRGAAGEALEFTLRRATAAYVAVGEQHAPRLRLIGNPPAG